MDILNNLFVNIYLTINDWLRGVIQGLGLRPDAQNVLVAFIMGLIVVTVLLLLSPVIMLYLTLMERKVVGRLQNRLGPNRVGPWEIGRASCRERV